MVAIPPIKSPTIDAIYAVYEKRFNAERERTYLGLSILGDECERKLWYGFRWVHPKEKFEGRMLRLFQSGHREEDRIIQDLRDAGIEIHETNPETGEQWGVVTAGGHVRGHLDGKIEGGVIEAPKARHVFEAKTHSVKSFKSLVMNGVMQSKPLHYAQMQGYMHLTGIDRALYCAVEKDTDTIHIERIKYDPVFAARLMAKGERIVTANRPLPKLHEDPNARSAFVCGWCPAFSVCHGGSWPRVNCRTCLHSTPVMEGDRGHWHCNRHDLRLSRGDQMAACPNHLFIPDLVPGKQTDADPVAETVTYTLHDGSTWIDGSGKVPGGGDDV